MKNKLEQLLLAHKRPCRVVEVQDAPQVIRMRLEPLHNVTANGKDGLYTKVSHLRSLVDDIEAGLGIGPVTVTSDHTGMWIELHKASPEIVWGRELWVEGKSLPLALGRDIRNRSVVLDLVDPSTPNVLIAGTTGSGKTILLHSIIYNLCRWTSPDNTRLILVDTNSPINGKGLFKIADNDGLRVWQQAPHVAGALSTPEDVLKMFRETESLLRKRYAIGVPGDVRYVIIVDEFADLMSDPVYGKDIHDLIGEIAQICRKKGVALVAATQRPSVDVIKGMAKANFPVRIAMTCASKVDSRVIIDQGGAERLGGRGDALLRVGMEVTRFQGALVDDTDVLRMAAWGIQWQIKQGYDGEEEPCKYGKEPLPKLVEKWLNGR